MPVAVTGSSRSKYSRALRNIDEAIVEVGEALRLDAEADAKVMKVVLNELRDASKRIRRRLNEIG